VRSTVHIIQSGELFTVEAARLIMTWNNVWVNFILNIDRFLRDPNPILAGTRCLVKIPTLFKNKYLPKLTLFRLVSCGGGIRKIKGYRDIYSDG
jgi:hypothetical protein